MFNQQIGRYYEGGISSVYMWEDENGGFVACFLIKKGTFPSFLVTRRRKILFLITNWQMILDHEDGSKSGHGRRGYLQEGAWDAIHVIEVVSHSHKLFSN